VADQPQKTPWWKQPHFWAALTTLGTLVGMTCPLWPPPYNVACTTASQGLQKGGQLGGQLAGPPASSPAPSSSSGPCRPGQVQSVPAFCKCGDDGVMHDYFDAGPCGP
jgi:hypothetical protein